MQRRPMAADEVGALLAARKLQTKLYDITMSVSYPKLSNQHSISAQSANDCFAPDAAIRKREVTARIGHGTAIPLGYASRFVLFVQSGNGLPLNRAALSLKDFELGLFAITPETDIESAPT